MLSNEKLLRIKSIKKKVSTFALSYGSQTTLYRIISKNNLNLFKSTKVRVPHFNTKISGINSYKKVFIQAALYFVIFSLGVFIAKLRRKEVLT